MRRLLAVPVLALLAACGGGGGSSSPSAPSTPAPTPRPSSSRLTLGVIAGSNTFTVRSTTSSSSGRILKCGDYSVRWEIIESAGLGATLTRGEAWLQEADGDISQRRVSDSTLAIPANGRVTIATDRTAECGWEGEDLPMVMNFIATIRDDAGITHTLQGAIGFTER